MTTIKLRDQMSVLGAAWKVRPLAPRTRHAGAHRFGFSALALAGALGLVACGGDDAGAGNGAGGSGGVGGAAGSAGAGGNAGNAGSAGSGGAAECQSAAECEARLPDVEPAGCAEAVCDTVVGRCVFRAKDGDGDGHGTAQCVATEGGALQAGDDCDDADPSVYPGAWDGPEELGNPDKPNRCDDVDQDCSGSADDKSVGGTSCSCDPEAPPACAESELGAALPGLDTTTAGVGACVLGERECVNGAAGRCLGAVGPRAELCNGVDDDCNGVVDDGAAGAPTWFKDSDNDGFGDASTPSVVACAAPGAAWKQNLPNTDCNDGDATTNPNGHDSPACDGIDHDCNGTPGTGCGCVTSQQQTCHATNSNVCNQTVITCNAGTWPACPSPIYKEQYCMDADNDGYCTSNCALACSAPAVGWRKNCLTQLDCDDTRAFAYPGAPETCGDSVNANCDITGADSDGFMLGACSAGVGACYRTGTRACSSLSSSACSAVAGSPTVDWGSHAHYETNSWDWNCDGIVQQRYNVVPSCNGLPQASCVGSFRGSSEACGVGLYPCQWNTNGSNGSYCEQSYWQNASQECR